MNYVVVIFSHLKTTGCFIHNAVFDLNCLTYTCDSKNKLLGII